MKNFFSHDEGARNDPKLIKVLMRLGQAGKGVYWDLIEMLYEQDGYLLLSECESYAFALRTECTLIQSLVNDFGLFGSDGERFWSESALRRIEAKESRKFTSQDPAHRLYQIDIKLWYQIRLTVFKRDDFTCQYCGKRGEKLECDHVHPFSKGGTNELENLTTACVRCNRQKKDKTVEEFAAWRAKRNA